MATAVPTTSAPPGGGCLLVGRIGTLLPMATNAETAERLLVPPEGVLVAEDVHVEPDTPLLGGVLDSLGVQMLRTSSRRSSTSSSTPVTSTQRTCGPYPRSRRWWSGPGAANRRGQQEGGPGSSRKLRSPSRSPSLWRDPGPPGFGSRDLGIEDDLEAEAGAPGRTGVPAQARPPAGETRPRRPFARRRRSEPRRPTSFSSRRNVGLVAKLAGQARRAPAAATRICRRGETERIGRGSFRRRRIRRPRGCRPLRVCGTTGTGKRIAQTMEGSRTVAATAVRPPKQVAAIAIRSRPGRAPGTPPRRWHLRRRGARGRWWLGLCHPLRRGSRCGSRRSPARPEPAPLWPASGSGASGCSSPP